jgi:isoleucyl-tRNA synthetase
MMASEIEYQRRMLGFVHQALEQARREKTIGSTLEAHVLIEVDTAIELNALNTSQFAELLVLSSTASLDVRLDPIAVAATEQGIGQGHINPRVIVTKTTNHKCGRCWRHLPEVVEDGALCGRCEGVVGG